MAGKKRIFGLEMENLPLYFQRRPDGKVEFMPGSPEEPLVADCFETVNMAMITFIKKMYEKKHVCYSNQGGIFHPENGCLYYHDQEHIEGATPECLEPRQVIAYSIVARDFLEKMLVDFNSRLSKGCATLVQNTGQFLDDPQALGSSNTRGAHENYSIKYSHASRFGLSGWFHDNGQFLGSFLVSRQLVCGNGCAYPWEDSYILSQRSLFIANDSGLQTTSDRSLLNQRDEPLANPLKYKRLHIIVGDANLAQWSIYLKFGITGIILSMIEDGYSRQIEKGVSISGEMSHSLHSVCKDPTGKKELIRIGARTISSLEHQLAIYQAAQEYFRFVTPSEWEKDVMEKWGYVLARIEANDIQALSDKLDWAIKLNYITKFMQKHNITHYSDPRVRMLDFQYHELHPERSIFKKLQDKQKIQTILTPEEREYAKHNPPKTRAMWRKIITEELEKKQIQFFGEIKYLIDGSNWSSISCGKIKVICEDPFASGIEEILNYQLAVLRSVGPLNFVNTIGGNVYTPQINIFESYTGNSA